MNYKMHAAACCAAALTLVTLNAAAQTGPVTTNGTWSISPTTLVNGPGARENYKGFGVINAIWFSSTTNGAVSIGPDSQAQIGAGSVEHMNAPLQADTIAINGQGTAAGGGNDIFQALWPTSAGLVAVSLYGPPRPVDYIVSADQGRTFTRSRFYGSLGPKAFSFGPPLALTSDRSGIWHELDQQGGMWTSPTPPGPTSKWTNTWHWGGGMNPDPFPKNGCQMQPQSGYFTTSAPATGPTAFVSHDGKTIVFNYGGFDQFGEARPLGVCRSTDGGKLFTVVPFAGGPPSNAGLVIIAFAPDDKHGISLFANATMPQGAWLYRTADGGATWQKTPLPQHGGAMDAAFVFTSPSGVMWIGGDDAGGPALWRSNDGGATWTNQSQKLRSAFNGLANAAVTAANANVQVATAFRYAPAALHSGFALDDNNIWLGADNGWLFYSSTGGQ